MKKIVIGGGCFWGVQEYFSRIPGVLSTKVGYANSNKENPTYEQVCAGSTNAVEAVYIEYDEFTESLNRILDAFWTVIDPTLLNQQGPDKGTQYRTGIYTVEDEDDEDMKAIQQSLAKEQDKYLDPIVTETKPLENFYDAEEYHQRYLKKNPGGYCHIPGL